MRQARWSGAIVFAFPDRWGRYMGDIEKILEQF